VDPEEEMAEAFTIYILNRQAFRESDKYTGYKREAFFRDYWDK
jgi:hypothetical protein